MLVFSDQNQLSVLLLLGCFCNATLSKTNNINKFEAMPTIAEHSQSCPTPQLAEQCVNSVVAEMSVSLFFLNFWKDLGGKCVILNEINKLIDMKIPSPLLQEEGPLYVPSLLPGAARESIGTLHIKHDFWSANNVFYQVKWYFWTVCFIRRQYWCCFLCLPGLWDRGWPWNCPSSASTPGQLPAQLRAMAVALVPWGETHHSLFGATSCLPALPTHPSVGA